MLDISQMGAMEIRHQLERRDSTVSSVAEQAGVSVSAASNVINHARKVFAALEEELQKQPVV